MATIRYTNVGIRALASCVPSEISDNRDLASWIPADEVEKTIQTVGIRQKRISAADVCSSDLCFKAAEKLFSDNNIDKESIDMVLFMSQTPDYIIPATSPILQHRLGLAKSTAAMDLSLGCSGYVYALSTAFAYASASGINRVLLLVGETFSKIVNSRDKVNFPLYGDAGTATLIEKGNFGESLFLLHSDGSSPEVVMIKAGGARNPSSLKNLMEEEAEGGNRRNAHQVYMDGMAVFNFALREVPKSIKELAAQNQMEVKDIDTIVFHQANKFMTDFFVKKLKYDIQRVPYCLDRYGNTSSASIPLTLSSELSGSHYAKGCVALCGFGAGLSWGSCLLNLSAANISTVIDY